MQIVRDAQAQQREPSTLPEYAIQVLGRVMYDCLRSDRLDGRFKGYLLKTWWNVYWPRWKESWAKTDEILEALVRGGGFGESDMAHLEGLEEALEHIDVVDQISSGGKRLRERFGLSQQPSPH